MLHHIVGYSLFVVMAGLIGSGLTYKFAKPVLVRKMAKKIHLALAYMLIVLWIIQIITVI